MSGYDPRDLRDAELELEKICSARDVDGMPEEDGAKGAPFASGDLVLLPAWLMTSSVPYPTAPAGIVVDCIPGSNSLPGRALPRWWNVNVLCTLSLHGHEASSEAAIYSFSYDTNYPPGSKQHALRLPGA